MTTDAMTLLDELKTIPKMIKTLEQDAEEMKKILSYSPQWSHDRVTGGRRRTQEDKLTTVINVSDINREHIEQLVERRNKIIKLIESVLDMEEYTVVLYYVTSKKDEEVYKALYYSRATYYKIKNRIIEKLNKALEEGC